MLPLLLSMGALAGAPQVVSTTEPIRIDGSMDEAAWATAEPVTDFLKFQPIEGPPPPGQTRVRFLQDDKNLYVGIEVTEADYEIRARISRREDINADDQVGVYIDTFNDERTGYIFYFNGLGIQQDIRVGPGFSSFSWNTVLRTKGQVTDDGFTLEVAIPWRSIKYPKPGDGPQTWGLILTRKIPSEGAKYSFPKTERNHPRIFTQAADLTGVRPPKRGSGLELIPSLTVVQQASRETPDDPLRWVDLDPKHEDATKNWLQVVRPSLDARLGITPNIGLAATVNPDFSQVDQDPTFIDLNQRFAFYLPEQRPFFLDGTEYFTDQHDTLYSRSIVDPVYGIKLSGREGAYSVGALHALDRSPGPSVNERGTPGFTEDDVKDAYATTEVARLRVDAFGQGYVGATFADKRIIGKDGRLRGANTAGGIDAKVPLGGRWTVDANMLQTLTGADGNQGDWGQNVNLGVNRAGGIGTGFWLWGADTTLGLRQETGFRNQSGITQGGVGTNHTFEPQGKIDTFTPYVDLNGKIERNGEQQQFLEIGQNLVHHGIHSWDAWFGASHAVEGDEEDEDGKAVGKEEVYGWFGGVAYRAELSRVVAVNPVVWAGRTMDFANLKPAHTGRAKLVTTLRPTPGLRLDTTVQGDVFLRDDGTTARATLLRHWTALQFTQALGLRSLIEHSSGNERDDKLVTTLLLTWLKNPGTAVHLGWVERTGLEGSAKTLDRSVFLKASVLLRP